MNNIRKNAGYFKVIAAVVCLWAALPLRADSVADRLDSLDAEVGRSAVYINQKEAEIERLKNNLRVATFVSDRYLSCKQLYIAYCKFNPDSAELYARKCHGYGVQTGNAEWQQESLLGLAALYTLRSDFTTTAMLFDDLPPIEEIVPGLQAWYACMRIEEYTRKCSLSTPIRRKEEDARIWERYGPYIPKNDVYYYIYKGALQREDCDQEQLLKSLTEILRRKDIDIQRRAYAEYGIYNLLAGMGRKDEAMRYLIHTAIIDIRHAHRDSQALLDIVRLLNNGEESGLCNIDRLYSYIRLCTDNIRTYRDIGRSIQLTDAQQHVQQRYAQLMESRSNSMLTIIIALAVMVIVLAVTAVILRRTARRRRKESIGAARELEELRHRLADNGQRIEHLERKTAELRHAVEVRDQGLVEGLRMNSELLKSLKLSRKAMLNRLKAGQLAEAKKALSESLLNEKELKALHDKFDAMFLAIHPDFVERFNGMLQPEAHITPEQSGSLTPELRIYALICMGLTDSVSIADCLHYSVQTIYNYRLKVRHSAAVPEKTFDETVARMYQ